MRYASLFTVILVLAAQLAFAQTTLGLRAAFGQTGVRSGEALDLATDRLSDVGTASYGLVAEIPISEAFSLRPGLMFTRRGAGLGLTQDVELFGVPLPVGARAKTRFRYVEAPVLLQYHLPVRSAVQPYLLAGPSIGYATGGKVTTSARAIIELDLFSTPVNLDAINYERMHLALVGGAGLKARLGAGTDIFVEAQYERGLTQPYDVPVLKDRVGFQGWNIGAGVAFALGQ